MNYLLFTFIDVLFIFTPMLHFGLSVVLPIILMVKLLHQMNNPEYNYTHTQLETIPVPLGDRMKYYEQLSESLSTIPAGTPFINRYFE